MRDKLSDRDRSLIEHAMKLGFTTIWFADNLFSCPICKSLVIAQDADDHLYWHRTRQEYQ